MTTTTTMKAKPAPARTLEVLSVITSRVLVVAVKDGRKCDQYTISSDSDHGAIFWSHTIDKSRRYRLECGPLGPVSCDCPATKANCRHVAATKVLIKLGTLTPPNHGTPPLWLKATPNGPAYWRTPDYQYDVAAMDAEAAQV